MIRLIQQSGKGIDIWAFLGDCMSRGLTKHTLETAKSNITTFLNFVGDPLKVDTSTLRNFLDYLRNDKEYKVGKVTKKGVSPVTLKDYFSSISSYYDFLVYTQQIGNNPIIPFRRRYLRFKEQRNGENSRQLISIEQMKQLINLEMPIQHKAILMVLAKTGVRRGELIAMDVDDINLEKKEIILKPKAKRTNRLVFFDEETAQVLRLFLEWRKTRARFKALFISLRGCRIHKDEPREIVTKYGSLLGLHNPEGSLNQKLTPHAFRHWHTTHLRRAGMQREFIQELRGDRREDAIDIYNHIDLSQLKEAYLKCIPSLLEKPVKLHETDLLLPIKSYTSWGISQGILSVLRDHPGFTATQITKDLKEDRGSTSSLISKHIKKGYIRRDKSSRLYLTTQFNSMFEEIITVGPTEVTEVSDQGVTKTPRVTEILTKETPDQRVTVKGVTESPERATVKGATVSPIKRVTDFPEKLTKEIPESSKRGRPKNVISGFTLILYGFVKTNQGLDTTVISQHFGKINDSIRRYLNRLMDYGFLIKDNGKWYLQE